MKIFGLSLQPQFFFFFWTSPKP